MRQLVTVTTASMLHEPKQFGTAEEHKRRIAMTAADVVAGGDPDFVLQLVRNPAMLDAFRHGLTGCLCCRPFTFVRSSTFDQRPISCWQWRLP